MIWDDHPQRIIGELSFRQVVLGVKLRRDAIAVALRDRVYVYHLADLSLRDKIYTADNPHGLLCLSNTVQDMVLACPSVTEGHVRVELYGLRKTALMEAHESSLRALALSADGTKLASSSVKGTVIRVWDVANSSCLQEFRRGVERANIACLAWNFSGTFLACTSDKGTTHVFALDTGTEEKKRSMSKRIMKSIKKSLLEVGESQKKSVCQIRGVPHPHSCAFLPDSPNSLAVAGWDADGNGVLLISEYHTQKSEEEPKRTGYHVVARSFVHEDESSKRRRRMMGVTPSSVPSGDSDSPSKEAETAPEGTIHVGERLEVLEGMKNILLEEEDDSGFVSVSTKKQHAKESDDHDGTGVNPTVTTDKTSTPGSKNIPETTLTKIDQDEEKPEVEDARDEETTNEISET